MDSMQLTFSHDSNRHFRLRWLRHLRLSIGSMMIDFVARVILALAVVIIFILRALIIITVCNIINTRKAERTILTHQ